MHTCTLPPLPYCTHTNLLSIENSLSLHCPSAPNPHSAISHPSLLSSLPARRQRISTSCPPSSSSSPPWYCPPCFSNAAAATKAAGVTTAAVLLFTCCGCWGQGWGGSVGPLWPAACCGDWCWLEWNDGRVSRGRTGFGRETFKAGGTPLILLPLFRLLLHLAIYPIPHPNSPQPDARFRRSLTGDGRGFRLRGPLLLPQHGRVRARRPVMERQRDGGGADNGMAVNSRPLIAGGLGSEGRKGRRRETGGLFC